MPSFVVGFLPICLPFAVAFSIPLFALALVIDNSNWLKTPAIGTVPIPYDCPRICILRKLCEQKGIEIHEANACPDHIHMLVSIPPKISVAYAVGYLKGKSSLMIFDRHANLKYKYGNRHFWCRGYYVDTVGRNKEAIAKYIRNQLQEDAAQDQISIRELIDPFTGEPVKDGKR